MTKVVTGCLLANIDVPRNMVCGGESLSNRGSSCSVDSPHDLSETLWVYLRREKEKGLTRKEEDAAAELGLSVHMMNESVSHQSSAEQL